MASVNPPVVTFTGGILGGELHNRVDIPSYQTGCSVMENLRPKLQGPMTRRPPLLHVDAFDDHNAIGKLYKFLYSDAENYLVLHTSAGFQFYVNDERVTIPSVTASLEEEWTAASAPPTTITVIGTDLWLDSDGSTPAIARKEITTSNVDTLHVLKFEIVHGLMNVRIGTSAGGSDLMNYTRLRTGVYHLAFTPTASVVYLEFWHEDNAGRVLKDNVAIATGTTSYLLPSPYLEADIRAVDREQIRDVMYLTHRDYWPRRLERRGQHSWSIAKLMPDDGPLDDANTTSTSLTPSGTRGEINLTASADLFVPDEAGTIYELSAGGQNKEAAASTDSVFTDGIKVTGIGAESRSFTLTISGTFVATVTLQRSSGNENDYTDWQTYTSPQALSVYDAQDNQTWYYRLAVKAGAYSSGTANLALSFQGGSTTGLVRVVQYTSATQVVAEVVGKNSLASVLPTRVWKRGSWNTTDGFPDYVTRGFGRLFLGRGSTIWASKSDNFTSFAAGTKADEAFTTTVASPASDSMRWLAMLNHLVIGTSSQEQIGLGSTTTEPVGPTNFQLLDGSEEGSIAVKPVVVGNSVLYVHRSKRKLMQFLPNPRALSETSYVSVDLTARSPEILNAEIVGMSAQREPDRRIYVWLASGRLVELLFRREGELDVVAWSNVTTGGRIEDGEVVPSDSQDTCYFITRRETYSNSGVFHRAIEKYGPERILCPDEYGHLDAAVRHRLERPDTVARVDGTSGRINITTDEDSFVEADVGSTLWINGGRGTIDDFGNARIVAMQVTTPLESDDAADSGTWGFGPPMETISGLDHLEGQTVRIFGDLKDLGTAVVADGEVALPEPASMALVGLHMRSRWRSLKLAYGAQKGSALTMPKAIKGLGLLLYRTGAQLAFGPTFSKLFPLKTRSTEAWDEPTMLYTGEKEVSLDVGFSPDPRLCLEIDGPAPATIAGYVPRMDTRDR